VKCESASMISVSLSSIEVEVSAQPTIHGLSTSFELVGEGRL
jgi:hypothetical protein